ncbi:putative Ig domain-containing protein [Bacteriovorax sp. PP10]|uniref:Ig domain-containing protein n=1 Tax=Bacteriovorax antarcticus TaxID=3088717 RepID=A0ABU5VPQ6_9BACT|nr:putative Ig domain-containing protein [Bacteriovorax sp. PP10]MEA9355027.1 putative Ig domain-containing protein [Bacteriovorax sp. PP10]
MKTFNTKLIVALFTTLVLTGCMPDSLTKFKKDPPKKAIVASDDGEEIPTGVPDGSGGVISLPDLVDATSFSYPGSNDLVLEAGVAGGFEIFGDNSFASQITRESLIQTCTVTPTLPPGLSIDTKTCAIAGTPSQVYIDTTKLNLVQKAKKDFVVTVKFLNKDSGITTLTRAIKLQILAKPTKLLYSQSSKVLLKVTGSLTAFSSLSGDLRTDDGESPSYIGKNSIYATVETLDLTNNIVGVNNKRNYDYQGNVTNFTDANFDYQPDTDPSNPKYYFRVNDDIDNDTTYSQALARITEVRNILPTYSVAPAVAPSLQPLTFANTGVNVNEVTSKRNYLEFTVSPKLPTGLTLDAITGKISGYSTVPVAMKTYQITASNALGSASYQLQLEIIDPPAQLSLTKKQVLTVGALTYSYLREGDSIVSPLSATPVPKSVHGIITKMIPSTLQLEIATIDGSFAKNDQIDLGKTFNAMIGTILTTPINFNAAVTLSAPVSIPAGGLAATSTMYAHNNTALPIFSDRVYVTATDTAAVKTGDLILGNSIVEIDAETLKVRLLAGTPNLAGLDALSTGARAAGYVYEQASPTSIYISNLFRSINLTDIASRNLRHADVLKFDERSTGAGVTATIGSTAGDIAYDNYYAAERGVYSEYKANLVTGSGITYSIEPTLPLGMSLSPTTGLLSGIPLVRSANDDYVITAKNLLSESKVNIRFEVRDYFTLSETSGAPSYKLHRVGDYQNSNSCRVNAADIFNERGHRDIRCFMDGEEQDIHSFGMKLKASIGPGVCKFVSITPYQFWKWSPKMTNATVVRWENSNVVTPSDREITADLDCDGNYSLEGGPNCDEGSITVHTYKYDPTATAIESFSSTSVISCGGKATNCLDGPIRDVLEDTAIKSGMRGTITNSDTGFSKTWDFTAPITKGDITNLRIVNNLFTEAGGSGSKCSASAADVDDNISLSYVTLSTLFTILDTRGAFYTPGTDTTYYGSSRLMINGFPRGSFITANNARTVKPYKVVKINSKYGPFDGAFPYYQVSCLDAAQESVATANIVVRDWNQKFKLQHEIDKESPDLALSPILMRATGGTVVNPVNDFADWNDNFSESTAPYFRPENAPDYSACATAPVYALPATKAAVPTMVYPDAAEFQFPEGSL